MAYQRKGFQVDDAALGRIWAAQGLGSVKTVDWAGKGINNPALLINDNHVVRFDGIINKGVSRFHGEQTAYGYLKTAGVPCPDVVVLDDSKTLVPYDYMIMTRMVGTPLLDSWETLTNEERQQVAKEAGLLLAMIHTVTLPKFGRLYGTERVFDTWYGYVMDKFARDGQSSVEDELITQALFDRMQRTLEDYQPTFDTVTKPHLIHWDYHFGNLLQQDGKITAVLDFEWGLGGDPAHDFNRRSQWEEECPGSMAWVYNGSTGIHALEADHEIRVSLYEMLWYLDCVVDARDADEAADMRDKLVDRLSWLENN